MKTFCKFLLIFCFPCAVLGDTNAAFSITYIAIETESIYVRNGRLEYWWRTQRAQDDKNYAAVPQPDTGSYDNHQINVQLTPEEMNQLQKWAENIPLPRMPPPPRLLITRQPSPISLEIRYSTDTQRVDWSGDQMPEKLLASVRILTAISQEIAERHGESAKEHAPTAR